MFESAKQKIERAEYHIADLERQFAEFVATKPHRFIIEADKDTRTTLLTVQFLREPPASLALVIGDAIHNARCALDHAVWEMVGRDRGTQDRYLKFPAGDNRVNFEAACKGVKTPSQWVKNALIATEAFSGGRGDELYDLHQLDNSDKHTVLAPIVRATSHPPFEIINPDGSAMVTMENNVAVGGSGDRTVFARVGSGLGIRFMHDADCPPSIFSSKPSARMAVPTIPMLRGFAAKVSSTITAFEIATPV